MENETGTKQKTQKRDYEFILQFIIVGVLLLLIVYNLGKLYGNDGGNVATGFAIVSASEIIPSGVPAIYGDKLGVRYDDVSPNNPALADTTIAKLSQYEDADLDEEQMQRYIKIGSSISCEYCCGAQAIIFSNGQRACGCAHSYAMRGLAKYLLMNNSEMNDEEILNELGKWKVLFFPGIHEQKAQILKEKGIDPTNYINLASNLYRGIEQGPPSGGGMVGGC